MRPKVATFTDLATRRVENVTNENVTTQEFESVTQRGGRRPGSGRKRRYNSNAERQAAYRERRRVAKAST